ncbi:MAG: hypothetical protein ABSG03_26350 [Bryobacteraceae bacterium]
MSPPTSPLRQFLEKFAAGAETLYAETRDQARREIAAELNQAVRRLRQSTGLEELAATLADTAARFAGGAEVFLISDGMAKSEKMELEIPLASAAALAGAVESRDPVTALTTAREVSAALVERLKHSPDARAHIYPLVVKDGVPALLYAWGGPQRAAHGPALELVTQVAAAQWLQLLPPPPSMELVSIAPLGLVKAASSWESLAPEEQRIHLRAQRFARVQAAEMRLHEGPAVLTGRSRRNLYEALRDHIDAAREQFQRDFFARCPSMVDYLHVELVRTLANDDAELLGENYPGPMV